jgi:hypothetical protein
MRTYYSYISEETIQVRIERCSIPASVKVKGINADSLKGAYLQAFKFWENKVSDKKIKFLSPNR